MCLTAVLTYQLLSLSYSGGTQLKSQLATGYPDFMVQGLSWKAYSYSSGQEIPCFYRTWRFITVSVLVFWVVMPCGLVGRYILTLLKNILPPSSGLKCWRWRQYVSPKRWYLPKSPHTFTTQNTDIDIFAAVEPQISYTIRSLLCSQKSAIGLYLSQFSPAHPFTFCYFNIF
jgi:hypothetical protein